MKKQNVNSIVSWVLMLFALGTLFAFLDLVKLWRGGGIPGRDPVKVVADQAEAYPNRGRLSMALVKAKANAYAIASDYDGLVAALASDADVVIVVDTVDVTGRKPIVISRGGVTLLDAVFVGRGFHQGGSSTDAAVINTGDNNVINNCVFIGPASNPYNQSHNQKYSWCGIRNDGRNLLVQDCRFWNCYKWGLWFRSNGNSRVENCVFDGIQCAGYGYGIWAGSKSDSSTVTVKSCWFNRCRVFGDAGGHICDVEWIGNGFGPVCSYTQLQRHDASVNRGYGGRNFTVLGNYFWSTQNPINVPVPADSSGVVKISENHFVRECCGSGAPQGSSWCEDAHKRVGFDLNECGDKWPRTLVEIKAGSDTIRGGNRAVFSTGLGSRTLWNTGGGDFIAGDKTEAVLPPGGTDVMAWPLDPENMAISPSYRRVYVEPDEPVLVFSYMHTSPLVTGTPYVFEVFVGEAVAFCDTLNRMEAWRTIALPLKHRGRIAFGIRTTRSTTAPDSSEIALYVDDFYLTGSVPAPGWKDLPGFEAATAAGAWRQKLVGTWSSGISQGFSRSGSRSWQFSNRYGMAATKGNLAVLETYRK